MRQKKDSNEPLSKGPAAKVWRKKTVSTLLVFSQIATSLSDRKLAVLPEKGAHRHLPSEDICGNSEHALKSLGTSSGDFKTI